MRTGLVPVNQKYAVLFSNSPLRMQIIDSEGNAEFSSAGARPISREDWEKLRDDIKHPLLLHGDTLLYAARASTGSPRRRKTCASWSF